MIVNSSGPIEILLVKVKINTLSFGNIKIRFLTLVVLTINPSSYCYIFVIDGDNSTFSSICKSLWGHFRSGLYMNIFQKIGAYGLLMVKVFGNREKASVYWQRTLEEMEEIGVKSIGLVALMSLFMGAVITLQTASNIESPLIPIYLVGFATRESIILEFAPTMLSLILAGKVGSKIASELGTMRVTEQIDAIDIMGVNSAGYLILPKIVAAVITFPLLITVSMALGLFGGWIVATGTGLISTYDYVYGIHYDFRVYNVFYAIVKTLFFAFIITSVSAFYGYYAKGGSLEVGQSSTAAVVSSSVVILIVNYVLTQLMLI